ncbi:MAG: aldo/keto reductase [Muribaculaceae bacterium]|jgi:predicted aldo/keto reductase-like oxidoreductase|nr:aldo/keto reductase [Muribaculaceae bacterium]
MQAKKDDRNMNRRNFLKVVGAGSAVTAAALAGCNNAASGGSDDVPKGKMTYRTNPKTGEKVSLLGFGFMRLPQKPGKSGGEDADDKVIDQDAVNELVDYAMAHGVTYYDTSPRYCKGQSEHALGIALRKYPRSKYVIATKMSNFDEADQPYEKSVEMYHNSMKELHTDYLDYYLLHAIGDFDGFKARFIDNGILDFLVAERKAGRIKNLGWSFHGTQDFFDYMLTLPIKWDFVQIQLNYHDWDHRTEEVNADYLYGELSKRKIPAVIMEPLLGGALSKLNHSVLTMLKRADAEATPASWAFRFAGSLPDVLTVLSGMTYMEHLKDNIKTYSPLKPLTEAEKAMLEKAADMIDNEPTINCTGCHYCMPCPFGLDIPGIFKHYNSCLTEGNYPDNPDSPDYKKERRAFLIGYDRTVPRLRQADHCVSCHTCEPKCPQHIEIPAKMHEIDSFVEALKRNNA